MRAWQAAVGHALPQLQEQNQRAQERRAALQREIDTLNAERRARENQRDARRADDGLQPPYLEVKREAADAIAALIRRHDELIAEVGQLENPQLRVLQNLQHMLRDGVPCSSSGPPHPTTTPTPTPETTPIASHAAEGLNHPLDPGPPAPSAVGPDVGGADASAHDDDGRRLHGLYMEDMDDMEDEMEMGPVPEASPGSTRSWVPPVTTRGTRS